MIEFLKMLGSLNKNKLKSQPRFSGLSFFPSKLKKRRESCEQGCPNETWNLDLFLLLICSPGLTFFFQKGQKQVTIFTNFIWNCFWLHTFKNNMRNFHSRTVFKWMFNNQYQSNYSDQSQWEQKAWWTNQNSWQLSVNCWKCRKNQAYKVPLVLPLTVWITGTRFFSQSPNIPILFIAII